MRHVHIPNHHDAERNDFDLQQLEKRSLLSSAPLTAAASKGVLSITGSAFDDEITVSHTGNTWTVANGDWSKIITAAITKLTINAKAGNDSVTIDASVTVPTTVLGDLGNDTLVGSDAPTSLGGGAGDDSLIGGLGNDVMTGDAGNDVLIGGAGNNKLNGGVGDDKLTADGGNDSLVGDIGNDTLVAGEGNNTLNGGAGDDQLTAGAGNDVMTGDAGNDTLNGGDGANKLNGGIGNDVINAGTGADSLVGDVGNDTIDAGDGNDTLLGGAGNDSLTGDAGDDLVQGGLGTDTLSGGDGTDEIDYSDHTAKQGVWVDLAGTTDGGMTGEADTIDNTFEIANGGAGNDHFAGNDNGDTFYGQAGNDTINGGAGDDVIYGQAGNDALSGNGGADSVYGGIGDDLLQGGDGNDLLVSVGGGKKSILVGNDGEDTFWLDSDVTENAVDVDATETADGTVHRVAAFANKQSKDLTGQALADPALKGSGIKYRNFKNNPLFGDNGPSLDDVRQGQLGDCYFLAQLGSYAKLDPTMIKQDIVNFGDGTYGVQFTKGANKMFYRIDADLPSYSVNTLAYAAFGDQGSLWVALYEKAWTYARAAKNTYASIEAGFMTEVSGAFGKSNSWGYTSTANSLLSTLEGELAAGHSVTAGTGGQPAGSLLIGGHAYTVTSITDDGSGNYTVIVRNPWGFDGTATNDGANDGYITLTGTQFMAWTGTWAVAAA